MSIPALRKPKLTKNLDKKNVVEQQFIILTLKNNMKLVITSDAFHGIIMIGEIYRCVFCDVDMETHVTKEYHKDSVEHKKVLSKFSYIEELSENLVRPMDKTNCYCTICNVITSTVSIMRHVKTDNHSHELNRAITRASTYKPLDENNNK